MKRKFKKTEILEYVLYGIFIIACIGKIIVGDISRFDYALIVLCMMPHIGITVISERIINTQEKIIEKQEEYIELLNRR